MARDELLKLYTVKRVATMKEREVTDIWLKGVDNLDSVREMYTIRLNGYLYLFVFYNGCNSAVTYVDDGGEWKRQ